ncbi:MFS transporter [Acidisphaera sp. L21]|uniref:MFS transporter n=1 Tax=Acidisphaera sp. L21 TaxID=1641851 RepID=UPI00131B75B4|nr:MFS transporter [Acidisphaera sp. L21]
MRRTIWVGEVQGLAGRRKGSNWLTVSLCMLAYIFSYIDRLVLSLLVGPIRADLAISDTAFGLLTGLAFALFYATLGLPIATLSDRVSRPLVIAWGIVLWSVATMACGLASSFATLFAARVLVGAGEAALAPAVYSLLADLFPERKLGRALSTFSTGLFIGSGLAFLVGGSVIAALSQTGDVTLLGHIFRPWQVCFLLVGAPGLLIASAILRLVHEPFPGGRRPVATEPPFSSADVLRLLARHRALFVPHMLGFTLLAMSTFSLLSWAPAYFIRVHHMSPQRSGTLLGLLSITAGTAGVLVSGWMMDLLARRTLSAAPFWVGIAGAVCTAAAAVVLPFVGAGNTGIAVLTVLMFFSPFPVPTSTVVMQLVPPPGMRSRVSAVFLLCNSLGGLALGAALVGFLNDHVFPAAYGVASSMALVMVVASLAGALVLTQAVAPYRRHLNGLRPASVINAPAADRRSR